MKLRVKAIESNHGQTREALNEVFDELVLNNTSLTLNNKNTNFYLHTSSVKEIIIKTNNSVYTLERIDETEDRHD